ncbi:phospholipase D family protein [Pseudomonas fluorescens]|uniref:phospholipase D family protein n=1 Tax=Pseudomonas fluorescens TaxID=294 RepID=UPI0006426D07|nr:phospholipase D family protein [Pseudomonas fluorescens]
MLNPSVDRLDYGEKLQAPEGFQLSYAVATSYSLELDTLLCLPLALSLNGTLEGNPHGGKLAALEGIRQLKGRLKVFFQQGNIKVPSTFTPLFTLLEPCLVPMVPSGGFSSFHPKIWLLRFTNDTRQVRYRLLVLSRNLTFDRSWDLAVALEGEVAKESSRENEGLLELLQELAPFARHKDKALDFAPAFSLFKKELPRVVWQKPNGFRELKTLLGKAQQVPLDLGSSTNTVLVISPFLHAEALDMLKERGERRWLFSRAEELERLGAEKLAGWECFALNQRVVNGEDHLDNGKTQNLHAKLVLVQNGATSHWHVGSANATKAALGGLRQAPPRNTEFMLRLSSSGIAQSAEQLKLELIGSEENPTGVFIPHSFQNEEQQAQSSDEEGLRKLLHTLIKDDWSVRAKVNADFTYRCEVHCSAPLLAGSESVQVRFLDVTGYQDLKATLVWDRLSLLQVSAFLVVKVRVGDKVIERVIKASLIIDGGDGREQKIVSDLIDSPHKLLAYIRMVLQPDHEKTEWFARDPGVSALDGSDELLSHLMGGPIYESLLLCAARQPERLQRIEAVLSHLRSVEGRIPDDFNRLWDNYKAFLGTEKA